MSEPDEGRWQRTVLTGLAALGIAAVVIGVVAGLMALGVAKLSGLGDSEGPQSQESLFMPSYTPTPYEAPTPVLPSIKPSTSAPPPTTQAPTPSQEPTEPVLEITLSASPTSVAPRERVTMTGTYVDGSGDLQVQRFEGGAWVDFPVKAAVRKDGAFTTAISTAREGEQEFRVFDPNTGTASNSVTVVVG